MSTSDGSPASNAASAAQDAKIGQPAATAENVTKTASRQNPALRMMGLPRLRLPSRNWLIFWTITGSLASAIYYDKWQMKRVKKKWCDLVSSIADEPLDVKTMPRTVTVYLSAPPGDSLRSSREHFHNYIKPVLVAAAVNWDVIEGRKEGDVRYKTAQTIRDRRKAAGERTNTPLEEDPILTTRRGHGVEDYGGLKGDLVVGRHTWKEYMRGLHEGWLGPVDSPLDGNEQTQADVDTAAGTNPTSHPSDIASPVEEQTITKEDADPESKSVAADQPSANSDASQDKKEEEKPKPRFPPPYITPDSFVAATVASNVPIVLDPVAPVSCPHILGFRNTPIRFYRYLTRRNTADEIGRQVASAVLGHNREFDSSSLESHTSPSTQASSIQEQSMALQREERDWWKTVRAPRKEFEESVLIEPIVLNEQLASRMRLFELTAEDEERSKRISSGAADFG